jgi:hypothetical protein
VAEKQPKSDVQFAATVAFYHRFEAPVHHRKDSINAEDLREACRLVNRERLKKPLQTLNNHATLACWTVRDAESSRSTPLAKT